VPLVIAWPGHMKGQGDVRQDFVHVSDIAPTILEASRVPLAKTVNNVPQTPTEGSSITASFARAFDEQAKRDNFYPIHNLSDTAVKSMGKALADFKRPGGKWQFPGPVGNIPTTGGLPIRSLSARTTRCWPTRRCSLPCRGISACRKRSVSASTTDRSFWRAPGPMHRSPES
tara:strand:+ start:423 stop:938 length:516 start_codon:yes stop_codon:yes gene_type:complete